MQEKSSVRDVFNPALLQDLRVQDALNDFLHHHINSNLEDFLDSLEFQYQRALIKSDKAADMASRLAYSPNLTEEQLLIVDTMGYNDAVVENMYCNGEIYNADDWFSESQMAFFREAGVALVELRPHDIDFVLYSNRGLVSIRSENFPECNNSLICIDEIKDNAVTRTTIIFDKYKHYYQGRDINKCIYINTTSHELQPSEEEFVKE